MRRWWMRAAVSMAVVVILLAFVPIRDVWSAIHTVTPLVWAAAVCVFVGGHSLNALKLRLLVGPRVVSAASCLRAHFAGIAANLGLPGVAGGDIVRAAYLAPSAGASRVAVAAVADRIVDVIVLLLIVAIAAPLAGTPDTTAGAGRSRLWLAAIAIAVVVAVVVVRRRLRRSGARPRLQEAIAGILERPGAIGLAITISLSVQCVFVLTNVWLASEIGLRMPIAPWFLAWTGSKLSAIAPISLGGIGVREATLVTILAAYGAPADKALAVGILWEAAIVAGAAGGFLTTQLMRR
jgi:uncharacterized membrane protein YbhN (UPF0104 family)